MLGMAGGDPLMKRLIRNVLIGTPLGEDSDKVVAEAFEIAAQLGAQPHLAHAFELSTLEPGPYFTAPPAAIDLEELGKALDESMGEQIARLHLAARGPITRHIVSGPAHRVLTDLAHEVAADLLVVGAHRGRFARLVGSTASRAVRKAPCPVLILSGTLPLPLSRVLLPVDFSPLSLEVVTRGVALLAELCTGPGSPRRPELEVFHSVVPYDFEVFAPRYQPAMAKQEAIADLEEFLGTHHLGEGWQVACRAGFGSAVEQIAQRVAEWHPDLVVLGTHGTSGFERFLIGSVAEGVVRSCAANIMVIPPQSNSHEHLDLASKRRLTASLKPGPSATDAAGLIH
jgi:nucleotide-binding universal stress UspA family protein